MSKSAWIIVGSLATASLVMTLAIERRSANQWDARAEALKDQAAQCAQAAAENARLTNLVARVTTSQSLSPEQLRDLLRLRNEVSQLRKLEDQKAQLAAANARLREMEMKSQETLARARALPNYWPKDQLAFAGYAEPESALRSMLAAMKNGDLKALRDCFPPSSAPDFDAELKDNGGDPVAKGAQIKAGLSDFMALADGFHIVDQTMTASKEVTINLSIDGEGRLQKFVFMKTGNEWKIAGGD